MSDSTVVTLPDPDWVEDLQPMPPGVRGVPWAVDSPARDALGEDADRVAMVVWPYLGRLPAHSQPLAALPALRLVQLLTAGYEGVGALLPPGVQLANAAGVHDASTAELAVGLMLASLRGIDDAVRDAEQARWRHRQRPSLADRRVLVIGVGGVGGAIADRLAPFEVQLTRVASSARHDERGHVHGVAELPELLPNQDVVVLATPLNDSTARLVDARFLAAMPDDALLVNVGRGPVVDTGALVAELRTHRLHAALDVVDPEPLPVEHPLWSVPGLILTPHVGGHTTAMRPRALALVREQISRLASGRPPAHVVHP